ncbi:MAG: PDZ domain-containing protein [Planctomycetia bacterium]|jgi:hypothetical protein
MSGESHSIPSPFFPLVAACLLASPGPAAEPRDAVTPAESTAAVADAVEQLSSPQFVRREAATRTLANAGRPALGPLRDAVEAGDLEAASRALEVLREMLSATDAELVADVERTLEIVAAGTRADVAGLAAAALDFHRDARMAAARRGLEAHGALVRERQTAGRPGLEIEFNQSWSGGPQEWLLLPRLRGVVVVSVHGLAIDDAALEVLPRMKHLRRVELFGTRCTNAAVTAVAGRLPEVTIDVRRGGKLGVSAAGHGACIVHVQPGSAAARSGMRDGDVIVVADGRPVADFADFTAAVSLRAAGEEITLEVVREQPGGAAERFTCTARLDAW